MDLGGGMPLMMGMGIEPGYLFVFLATMVISMIAQGWIKASYAKYSRMGNSRNMTGSQAAQLMLQSEGINDVAVRMLNSGTLSDYYDPTSKTVNLSPDVFNGRSIAAVGVACHEVGHALQHARHYAPMALRSLLVKPTNFAQRFSTPLIILGLVLGYFGLVKLGFLLFATTFLFQVVTLPVEINASMRSKRALVDHQIVAAGAEARGVSAVLTAAAFTYIAAAFSSLLWLLYYAYRLGLLGGGNRRD